MVPPLTSFEDSALIKLTLAGQTECFTILTNRHLPAIRRRIGSMVPNTTDVDDLLQEALLKVWRHLSTFRSESTIRVAFNEAMQYYRLRQRRPICQALGDFDTFVSPHESPLQSLTRAETLQVVRKAVVELPAKYRQVLILREFDQLSEREAAQSLLQYSSRQDAAVASSSYAAGCATGSVIVRVLDRLMSKSPL